jgi:hypothetical protein
MRINKTKNNLQKVWELLDSACDSLDNAFTMINQMSDIQHIKDSTDLIDFTTIINLKNEIEELLDK